MPTTPLAQERENRISVLKIRGKFWLDMLSDQNYFWLAIVENWSDSIKSIVHIQYIK